MRRAWFLTAALVAAVVVCVVVCGVVFGLATLPPKAITLNRALPGSSADGAPGSLSDGISDNTVRGVIHIHTNRSDGRSSPDEVAAAASAAGLAFIVLTDHGDAMRPLDPPVYRHGVFCIDAVEISTTGGHYVALGLPSVMPGQPAAPYPLGGEARDVVTDVARLGGFGVAAHPDSPKGELRWSDWNAPIDGMEIVNPDSGWRKEVAASGWRPKLRLLERVLSYPVRPAETIASFLTESDANLTRWDSLTRHRPVVGLAGADAHSKLALRNSEPGDNRLSLPIPGYEASFRTLSVNVRPRTPLSGNAPADAAAIIDAVRAGHLYTALDGLASPPAFLFTAEGGGRAAEAGDTIAAAGPIVFRVRSNAPRTFTTTIVHDGRVVATSHEPDFRMQVDDPMSASGAYRVEIHASDRARSPLWLFGNPIYLRASESPPVPPTSADAAAPAAAVDRTPLFDGTLTGWDVEHDPASTATALATASLAPNGAEGGSLLLTYALAPLTATTHAFAALSRPLPQGLARESVVTFTAHADRPMRVSVQVRTNAASAPEGRWQRSIYLDGIERIERLAVGEFTPVAGQSSSLPFVPANIGSVLFVVDAVNTVPGTRGAVTFGAVALEHAVRAPGAP